MSHPTVGQLELMGTLTERYFRSIRPKNCIFLGVAGGNGLEYIDPVTTKHVIGIDINQEYLDTTFNRHCDRLSSLQVINLDLTHTQDTVSDVQLIWAALIVEYVGIDNTLRFSCNNLIKNGHLIVTVQSNRGASSVSPTGVESVRKIGQVFQSVNPETLFSKAGEMGFVLVEKAENELPNGKSFLTFHFMR